MTSSPAGQCRFLGHSRFIQPDEKLIHEMYGTRVKSNSVMSMTQQQWMVRCCRENGDGIIRTLGGPIMRRSWKREDRRRAGTRTLNRHSRSDLPGAGSLEGGTYDCCMRYGYGYEAVPVSVPTYAVLLSRSPVALAMPSRSRGTDTRAGGGGGTGDAVPFWTLAQQDFFSYEYICCFTSLQGSHRQLTLFMYSSSLDPKGGPQEPSISTPGLPHVSHSLVQSTVASR